MALDTASYKIPVARTVADLRAQVSTWRLDGLRIGFVPTMGALHEGHLSLVDLAAQQADKVVVSIFVNPTQFAPSEDLDAYPRTEPEDAAKLASRPCDLIFGPNGAEMYPDGYDLQVSVGGVSTGLETDHRPHFFGGVATVVAKLLVQVAPDVAVFGEKDYQQLQVIKKLVRDMSLPVDIVGGPTVREPDGLAMSSRNAYLSNEERKQAVQLSVALREVSRRIAAGTPIDEAQELGITILRNAGFNSIDYLEVRDADTLGLLSKASKARRVLAAAKLGKTRLIDNIALEI